MMEDAKREGATFVQMRPRFLANLSAELNIRNIQSDDQARMIAGIRKAGLPIAADAAVKISSPTVGSDLQPR
jgi:adenylate cyclase